MNLPEARLIAGLFEGEGGWTFADWPGSGKAFVEGETLNLAFDYDEAMKDELKGLSIGAGWKPERKVWQVPLTRWTVEKLAGYLKRHGFTFSEETLNALRQAAYGGK